MKSPLFLQGLLVILVSCGSKQEKTKPVYEKITESVYASGIVKSSNQYEVFSRVNGIVDKRLVKEGDLVDKGGAIVQLSGVTAQLQAENARIAAEHATQTANFQRLAELRLSIDLAKIKLEQDAVQLNRQRNLWAQQIGSRNELDQRELAWKTSRNNYDAACLRYAELKREISFGEKQAFKNLEISKSQVNDYTIKSEYSGKVYEILVEEGEMVTIQQPIAVVGDASSFLLELQVDEYDIARVRPGQKIIITMDSYRGQLFQAVVTKVRPFMHERSKTFTVEAQFLHPPSILYPNLTCEANIVVAQKENALTIPRACLLEGNYVLLANKEKRKVTTGLMDYQKVEIIKGITASDLILKPAP